MFFTDEELEPLTKKNMLRSGYINEFQKILKSQLPHVGGLYCCTIGGTLEFPKATGDIWTQIVHEKNHWVVVAKIGDGPVLIYDSLASSTWNLPHTLSCVSSLLRTPSKQLNYVVKSCQQQQNNFDCGVFAIAFVTSLAHGQDPNTILYDRRSLRTHLQLCMSKRHFTPFPSKPGRPTRGKNSSQAAEEVMYSEKVFCICRRTGYRLKSDQWDMVRCDACKEWYHRMCINNYPVNKRDTFVCD